MRFQKEKVAKARKNSIFNLDSNNMESYELTHRGEVLGQNTYNDETFMSSDDDDDNLGKDVVHNLHFGGGLTEKKPIHEATDAFDSSRSRSEKGDKLQEIIMKSKLFKMEKREAKDAQEIQRNELDAAYSELVKSASISFRPTGKDRSEDKDHMDEDDYDRVVRALAFETKVRPSDRTKSKEEVAEEERKKLEQLELERQKRLQATFNEKKSIDMSIENIRNYGLKSTKGKKVKREEEVNDDCVDFAIGERNKFEKFDNIENDDESEVGGSGSSESSEEDDNNIDSGDEMSIGQSDDDDYDDGDDDGEGMEEGEGGDTNSGDSSDGDNEDEEDEEEVEDLPRRGKGSRRGSSTSQVTTSISKSFSKAIINSNINVDMPHTMSCPTTFEEWCDICDKYIKHPIHDLEALLSRIVIWNNVNISGSQGVANKEKMKEFYNVLVVYLIDVGDNLQNTSDIEEQKVLEQQVNICVYKHAYVISLYRYKSKINHLLYFIFGFLIYSFFLASHNLFDYFLSIS